MANLNEWIGERGVKYQEVALFEKARDRELWKSMIAHVIGYGTEGEITSKTFLPADVAFKYLLYTNIAIILKIEKQIRTEIPQNLNQI